MPTRTSPRRDGERSSLGWGRFPLASPSPAYRVISFWQQYSVPRLPRVYILITTRETFSNELGGYQVCGFGCSAAECLPMDDRWPIISILGVVKRRWCSRTCRTCRGTKYQRQNNQCMTHWCYFTDNSSHTHHEYRFILLGLSNSVAGKPRFPNCRHDTPPYSYA